MRREVLGPSSVFADLTYDKQYRIRKALSSGSAPEVVAERFHVPLSLVLGAPPEVVRSAAQGPKPKTQEWEEHRRQVMAQLDAGKTVFEIAKTLDVTVKNVRLTVRRELVRRGLPPTLPSRNFVRYKDNPRMEGTILPIGPLRAWLAKRSLSIPVTWLAEQGVLSEGDFYWVMDPSTLEVGSDFVDTVLTVDGLKQMWELYPELYEEKP